MAKQELLGENTRENIYHCIKCGLCIAHCPVYKEVLDGRGEPARQGAALPPPFRGQSGVDRGCEGGLLLHLPPLRILRGELPQRRPRRSPLLRRALAGGAALRHRLEEADDVPASGEQVEDVHVGLVRQVGPQDVRRPLDRGETQRRARSTWRGSRPSTPRPFPRRFPKSSSPRGR